MTANALNITASNGAAGPAGKAAGPNAAAQAGNPLAGFEALLAALFPQADPTAVVAGKAGAGLGKSKGAAMVAAESPTDAADAADGVKGDAEADGETADASGVATDPTAALSVFVLNPALPAPTLNAKAKTGEAVDTGLLRGRVQGLPAKGDGPILTGKPGETAPEAAPEAGADAADAAADTQQDLADALAPKSTPPAYGRDKPKGAPAAPALGNANPHAELPQKVEARATAAEPTPAPVVDTTTGATPDAHAAAATAGAPAVAAHAEAAAATQASRGAKPAKSEKNAKASTETPAVGDAKAPSAAGKTETAKAVGEAAKPATAEPEAREAQAGSTKAAGAQPEPTYTSDTRGTPETAAPVAHTAHPVRGSPETVANLAAQIVKKLEARTTRFDVELDPLGLGKVNVRVEIGAQGALSAAMSFDNPQAAADVRARAAELHKALEQAGFDLNGGIRFDVAGDRGQSQQQSQAWQDQADTGRAFRGQAFRAALDTAGEADQAATSGALRLRRGVTAGLDVRI